MNQRGFLSSIAIYAIAGLAVIGLGYALYLQVQDNGRLQSENETLIASVEAINTQLLNQNKAQLQAQKLKAKAENDAERIHLELAALRKEHEKLLSIFLPDGLVVGLLNAIDETNSGVPTRKFNGTDKTPVPKISLGSLYEWATEAVPEAMKSCNADKEALRGLCR